MKIFSQSGTPSEFCISALHCWKNRFYILFTWFHKVEQHRYVELFFWYKLAKKYQSSNVWLTYLVNTPELWKRSNIEMGYFLSIITAKAPHTIKGHNRVTRIRSCGHIQTSKSVLVATAKNITSWKLDGLTSFNVVKKRVLQISWNSHDLCQPREQEVQSVKAKRNDVVITVQFKNLSLLTVRKKTLFTKTVYGDS